MALTAVILTKMELLQEQAVDPAQALVLDQMSALAQVPVRVLAPAQVQVLAQA